MALGDGETGETALNEWPLPEAPIASLIVRVWALAPESYEGVDGGSCGYADDASKQSGNGDQLPTSYAVRSGGALPHRGIDES